MYAILQKKGDSGRLFDFEGTLLFRGTIAECKAWARSNGWVII